MSRDNDLPFARGSTYCGGDTTAIAALGSALEGKVFETVDSVTNLPVRLRVVKASAAITAPAGRGLGYTAAYYGRRVTTFVAAAGDFGKIADPDLGSQSIVSGDLFYVIDEGYCTNARLGASSSTDGGTCCFDAAGYLTPLASEDNATHGAYVVGRFGEAAVTSTGQGNEYVDVVVGGTDADADRLA